MVHESRNVRRALNDTQPALLDILACPDCLSRLVERGSNDLDCSNCGRAFPIDDDVLILMPSNLDQHKQAEELAWQQLDHEGKDKPAWMALIHKRDEIFYFTDRIMPYLSLRGTVLEIGAGSCWASSLMKDKFPKCYMISSDISATALQKGKQVCQILGASPDAFVACDAETLPFASESFDIVFGNAIIHHFSNPFEGLRSVNRVLKPGGTYCGGGELASGKVLGAVWSSRLGLAGKRERQLGLNEKIYDSRQWQEMFRRSGFENVHVSFENQWQYRLYHWFPPLYYKLIGGLPRIILRHVPCGIKITATKMQKSSVENHP